MIKKRIAAAVISVLMIATMATIPALATTIYGYYEYGAQTYSNSLMGAYSIQGAYPGWTATSVKSSYPSYSSYYKDSYYYEYEKIGNNYQLIYDDYVGGVGSLVTTYTGHDICSDTAKRNHYSRLHESIYSSSSIIDGVDTTVVGKY